MHHFLLFRRVLWVLDAHFQLNLRHTHKSESSDVDTMRARLGDIVHGSSTRGGLLISSGSVLGDGLGIEVDPEVLLGMVIGRSWGWSLPHRQRVQRRGQRRRQQQFGGP